MTQIEREKALFDMKVQYQAKADVMALTIADLNKQKTELQDSLHKQIALIDAQLSQCFQEKHRLKTEHTQKCFEFEENIELVPSHSECFYDSFSGKQRFYLRATVALALYDFLKANADKHQFVTDNVEVLCNQNASGNLGFRINYKED